MIKNSFTDYWNNLNWENLATQINNKTFVDVERGLNAKYVSREDMMALLSPAANEYLEPIVEKAHCYTRQRFGNTISFYVPLYLSNLCSNECTYCGFSIKNTIKRKVLCSKEIDQECNVIRDMGFEHLLLVTGEHTKKVGMDYFRLNIPSIRRRFSLLQMEVQPLSTNEYKELKNIGVDGVVVYQETYNKSYYSYHHLKGKKKDFFWRLDTPDRLGRAGIDKIGLGVLSGLSNNWRVDNFILSEHLIWLQQRYWKSCYSISFPRLRPCEGGGIKPSSIMNERQLLQTICAFRLLAPQVELSLSTRESSLFRNKVVPIAINSISAFSKTQPGGYFNNNSELEQFETHDKRHPKLIAKFFIKQGLQPIWKDWDKWMNTKKT